MSVTVYKVCVGKHFTIILRSEAGTLAIAYINMYMLAKHTHMVLRENCGKTMMLLHKTCIDGVESLLVHFTENCDLLCRMCLSVCLCLCLFCFYLSYALCECLRPCPCVCSFMSEATSQCNISNAVIWHEMNEQCRDKSSEATVKLTQLRIG